MKTAPNSWSVFLGVVLFLATVPISHVRRQDAIPLASVWLCRQPPWRLPQPIPRSAGTPCEKRSMATDNQLVRGLGGSGRHCWANQKRLDQGATTGLLCVFHSFLDTMLTQNTWCWWASGVPWCHHFVGSNPHGWAPYTLVGPTSRGEFQGGWKLDVFLKWLSRALQNHPEQTICLQNGRAPSHPQAWSPLTFPI